jgi:CoA:oxalate CoA-transferase
MVSTSAVGASTYPLNGLRVLDLTTHATGPFATQILAGLGATVVKIERPPLGDPERTTEPSMFTACNQGKHSLLVNLRDSAGRNLVEQLLTEADVLVEGFRPGVAERLGLSFEQAIQLRPNLIYASLPGYPSAGSHAQVRGYDVEYRALAGELHLNRDAEGAPQLGGVVPMFDFATGMYAALGVVTALLDSNHGAVHLETSILAAGLAWSFSRLIRADDRASGASSPAYRAADGTYLTVTAPVPEQLVALLEAFGLNDLIPGALDPFILQRAQDDPVEQGITDAIAAKPRGELIEILTRADIAHAPVLRPDEVFAADIVREMEIVGVQPKPWSRVPISGLPVRGRSAAPALDEHGDSIRARGWDGVEPVGSH